MIYNKRLKIKLSRELKTVIKFYYKEDYSSIIRDLMILNLEVLSRKKAPEISYFYEEVKTRIPEYFEYAKTKGFDNSFEKKYKEKKISSLGFIEKLYEELKWKEKVEDNLNNIIKDLKIKLKQNENSTR